MVMRARWQVLDCVRTLQPWTWTTTTLSLRRCVATVAQVMRAVPPRSQMTSLTLSDVHVAPTAPLPTRAGVSASALDSGSGMPAAWRKLSPYELRPGQVDTLTALATGGDVLSRQPTGSGKSLNVYIPAAARWLEGVTARLARGGSGPLPPLTVVQVRPPCPGPAATLRAIATRAVSSTHCCGTRTRHSLPPSSGSAFATVATPCPCQPL